MYKKSLKEKKCDSKKGFTLIELLVSVALFTIVMTIGLSVILSIIEGNKRTQSINSVVNNLNSSIDSMIRDIKTGIEYKCNSAGNDHLPITARGQASDCSIGTSYSSVSFISTITGQERGVKYEYIAPSGNNPGYIEKEVCSTGFAASCNNVPVRITSPEINVTDMRIYPKSMTPGSNQPALLIVIGGTARVNPTTVSNFYLQTFVSQRVLNI